MQNWVRDHDPQADAPWYVIRSDDKRRARINAIRLVLSPVPDERRDDDVVGEPDPKVVGPPAAAEPESDEYIFAIKPHELTREAH